MDSGETRRINPRWCRREHSTTGADQTPGTSSRHPLVGGPPAAGRQRVLVGGRQRCRRKFLDSVWSLTIAGERGLGPVRASVHLSQVLARSRGHTCRTPLRACSVSNATSPSESARLARKRRTTCNRGCGTCGVGPFWSIGEPPCSDDPVSNSALTGALVAGPRGQVKVGGSTRPPPG